MAQVVTVSARWFHVPIVKLAATIGRIICFGG